MLFKIDTFFKGSDNFDQLARITNVMGTEALRDYMRKYKLNLPNQCVPLIKACDAIPFEDFVNDRNKDRVSEEALDLLRKMLVYDKNRRITPRDAMKHPYFEPIRALQSQKTK